MTRRIFWGRTKVVAAYIAMPFLVLGAMWLDLIEGVVDYAKDTYPGLRDLVLIDLPEAWRRAGLG